MVEDAAAKEEGWATRSLKHGTVISLMLTAGLVFAGWSYNDALFRHFGLQPRILGLDKIDLALAGVAPVFYALITAPEKAIPGFLWSAILGIVIIITVIIYGKSRPDRKQKAIDLFDRYPTKFLNHSAKYLLLAFVIMMFLSAGFEGAKIDANALRRNAATSPLCYRFADADMIRGRLLGQSETFTIIKTERTTRIIKTDDLSEVLDC